MLDDLERPPHTLGSRLARVVRVATRAEEALADEAKAHRWLRTPNRALSGRAPLDLLDTDIGARTVERVLVYSTSLKAPGKPWSLREHQLDEIGGRLKKVQD